jgi:cytochrome c oxidase subunit III
LTAHGEAIRVSRPSGWWGMAVLVATEATLFGALVASYFYLRFQAPQWPPAGIEKPPITVPLVLTAVLVATAFPMHLAVRAARRGNAGAARGWLALVLFVASGYFAMQMHRFMVSLATLPPQRHAYASIVYTLAGGHHAHVFVGLLLIVFVLWRLTRGLNRYRLVAVECVALYWYFVLVLALVVTGTLLSAAV